MNFKYPSIACLTLIFIVLSDCSSKKEIPKIRADVFFRLKQGQFIAYADGEDKKVQFKLADIQRELPKETKQFSQVDLVENFERIYDEAKSIFKWLEGGVTSGVMGGAIELIFKGIDFNIKTVAH